MLRIARAPAVRFVGALVAIMCLGLVGTACAADGAPRLRVDYQPPRLSVDAHDVSLARVLGEIGEKVGFTVVGHKPDGTPLYIGNVRGLVERNCMRYFLAIDAYLTAASLPPAEQLERRLQEWHAGSERYPIQLREMGREEYLAMKRKEIQYQQATAKEGKPS